MKNITIKATDESDLLNIMNLWNNGEVMKYVGFPEGLYYTEEKIKDWYQRNKEIKFFTHFSIYSKEDGYCGETGYGVPKSFDKNICLNIKLLPHTHGKGIAEYALRFVINEVKRTNAANSVWVDPHVDNEKAIKMYKKLGFIDKEYPDYLLHEDNGKHRYMELLINVEDNKV